MFFSEVVLHQRLAADPEIITSQRYLSRDKKNGMNKMVTKMCKKYGFLEESAQFDPESVLAKVVFVRTHHMFSRILNYFLFVRNYFFEKKIIFSVDPKEKIDQERLKFRGPKIHVFVFNKISP